MKNPTGKKLDKLIFGMFDQMIEGVDQYNHSGSLWLIFTDEKQWVVEYTVGGTLWYNYKLFKNEMEFIGMDCVEDKEYITRWFEDRFLNKPKVEDTWENSADAWYQVENTIENGVKHTSSGKLLVQRQVEDTIQNGVKRTTDFGTIDSLKIEDTIQNGVKDTKFKRYDRRLLVDDAIQIGVKDTRHWTRNHLDSLEDTIRNGVKKTEDIMYRDNNAVKDAIQNGVKHTHSGNFFNTIERIEYTIENGVKETLSTAGKPLRVEDTIENGVRHTMWSNDDDDVEEAVQNGVKYTDAGWAQYNGVEYAIKHGEKIELK